MGIYKLNGCGNCTYNCCCKCEIGDACYHCKHCHQEPFPVHYVCCDCRRAWKSSDVRIWDQLTKRERSEWHRREGSPSCPQCGQYGSYVNYATRVPKRSDIQGWAVFKRVQDPELFRNSKPGTLARAWFDGDGIGCARHMTNDKKRQFWIPKRNSEIKDWINYMNQTKITSKKIVT